MTSRSFTRSRFIMEVTRRAFSGAAAAAAFTLVGKPKPLEPLSPGIKRSMQVDEQVTAEDLAWIKQMGIEYLNVQTGNGRATLENFLDIRKRVEAAGLKVWNKLAQRTMFTTPISSGARISEKLCRDRAWTTKPPNDIVQTGLIL